MGGREEAHLAKSSWPIKHELIPRLHCLEKSMYILPETINMLFCYVAQVKHVYIPYL